MKKKGIYDEPIPSTPLTRRHLSPLSDNAKEEMQKCRDNPHYFATTFMAVEENGKTVPFKTDLTEDQFNRLFMELCKNFPERTK